LAGFIRTYDNVVERIVDFGEALDDMKRLLKDISKTKHRQVLWIGSTQILFM